MGTERPQFLRVDAGPKCEGTVCVPHSAALPILPKSIPSGLTRSPHDHLIHSRCSAGLLMTPEADSHRLVARW